MRIGVLGGGAWGTALAQVAASDGEPVQLWARESEVCSAINRVHENTAFLPGVALSPAIVATSVLNDLGRCDALLIVTPAQHVRTTLSSIDVGARPVILCAKGIESATMALMSEVARDALPGGDCRRAVGADLCGRGRARAADGRDSRLR